MEQKENQIDGIIFVDYQDESQLDSVMGMVAKDLSEPYSIFTYRYFLQRFPELCILACPQNKPDEPIGCVVGKIDVEEIVGAGKMEKVETGYIGMLAVMASHRRQGIGKALVRRVLQRMRDLGCASVTLETEVSNVAAQHLYQDQFGFVREELLVRYYLNWGDAYRLRLWFA
mmetsp:Transcript_30430/g.46068  ORF Transcript_30430/g.46068 Transcript_30430/m.46068 type:complete len:172 (-) Transcript_30430:1326-1841(-)